MKRHAAIITVFIATTAIVYFIAHAYEPLQFDLRIFACASAMGSVLTAAIFNSPFKRRSTTMR